MNIKRLFPPWLRILISVVLLGVLFGKLDVDKSWEVIKDTNIGLLLLSFAVTLLVRVFSAYRWYVLLHDQQTAVSFGTIVKFVFISGFLGLFIPGGVGAELVRIYSLSSLTSDMAHSFSSVMVERVLGIFSLLLLIFAGTVVSPTELPSFIKEFALVALISLFVFAFVLMNSIARKFSEQLLSWKYLRPMKAPMAKLYVCLDDYRGNLALILYSLLLGVIFQFSRIARVIILASALGINVHLVYYLIFVPIIVFISQLPVSFAGLGVREAGYVYLFQLIGVETEEAFTMSVLSFVLIVLSTLPGAWLYIRDGKQSSNED